MAPHDIFFLAIAALGALFEVAGVAHRKIGPRKAAARLAVRPASRGMQYWPRAG